MVSRKTSDFDLWRERKALVSAARAELQANKTLDAELQARDDMALEPLDCSVVLDYECGFWKIEPGGPNPIPYRQAIATSAEKNRRIKLR